MESEGKQAPVYKFGATLFRLADNISVVFNRSFVAVDNGLETTSSMLWDNETTPDIEFIDSELYGIKDNRLHSDDKIHISMRVWMGFFKNQQSNKIKLC